MFLVDRHHFACALIAEGVEAMPVRPVADFSALAAETFWAALEKRRWCRPVDRDGRRRPFDEMPVTLDALGDDPYRSLASALRRAGGFAKKAAPFSEFAWADFLRDRISPNTVVQDFDAALNEALALATSGETQRLPGQKRGWAPATARPPRLVAPHAGR